MKGLEMKNVSHVCKTNQRLWNSYLCYTRNNFLILLQPFIEIKTIQEITLFLWFFSFPLFFLRNFIPSFCFWFFFSFFEQIQQNKIHPHTCLLVYYHINPKQKNTRSHYHRLANTIKQGWDGVGEQKKKLMSV